MSYAAAITLPDAVLGDYWPPSADLNGKIIFGPIQYRDAETLDLFDPSTTLDRVLIIFRNKKSNDLFTLDSENAETRDGAVFITQATGAWTFEIRHLETFLESIGDWSVSVSIFHGGSDAPLTIYTSTIKLNAPA